MCPDLAAFTAAAEVVHAYTVNNRAERMAALDPLDDTPKTVLILGTIELNADATKQPTSRRR